MARSTRSVSSPSTRNSSAQNRRAKAPRSSITNSGLIRYAPASLREWKIIWAQSSRLFAPLFPADLINKDRVDVRVSVGEIIILGHQPRDPHILYLLTSFTVLKCFDADYRRTIFF